MTQQRIYQILKASERALTAIEISKIAKQHWPQDTLHMYVHELLQRMKKWDIVDSDNLHRYFLTGIPLENSQIDEKEQTMIEQTLIIINHDDNLDLDVKEDWAAFFFARHKIKPLTLDMQDMDLASDFLLRLKQSLQGGYDKSKPIIVAESKNQEVNGQLIDGLHRCYTLQILYEQEKIRIEPSVRYEQVRDADELHTRKLHYELVNQSKSIVVSNRKSDKTFSEIMKEHKELNTLEKVKTFFKSKGFTNQSVITSIYNRYQAYQEREKALRKRAKNIPVTSHHSSSYGIQDWASHSQDTTPSSFTSSDSEVPTEQKITCEHCHSDMIAYIQDDRIVKLKAILQEKIQ